MLYICLQMSTERAGVAKKKATAIFDGTCLGEYFIRLYANLTFLIFESNKPKDRISTENVY